MGFCSETNERSNGSPIGAMGIMIKIECSKLEDPAIDPAK